MWRIIRAVYLKGEVLSESGLRPDESKGYAVNVTVVSVACAGNCCSGRLAGP
jgi:hypothetical protein